MSSRTSLSLHFPRALDAAVSCASALRVLTSAEALHALGHQGAPLDASVILKSRDLILKPFAISHGTQAEGGTRSFQSDQWHCQLQGTCTGGLPPQYHPFSQCWGVALREPLRLRGLRGAKRAPELLLLVGVLVAPSLPRGLSASAAVPPCASRICPCSSGFCTDPQPPQVKKFKSCPSNQL